MPVAAVCPRICIDLSPAHERDTSRDKHLADLMRLKIV
jgi:hypothetical protein